MTQKTQNKSSECVFDETYYRNIERNFQEYLWQTSQQTGCTLVQDQVGNLRHHWLDYGHRWSKRYRSRFMRKMYCLEDWFKWQQKPVTFMTVTTHHDLPIPEQIILLKLVLQNILRFLKKRYRLSYLANMDFHKSGYAHYHILFFLEISEYHQAQLKINFERAGHGDLQRGLDFRVRDSGKITNIVRYIFKHSGKVFNPRHAGWLRFNSVVYEMHHSKNYPCVRLFQASRDIQKVMKMSIDEYDALGFTFVDKYGQPHNVFNTETQPIQDSIVRKYLKEFQELEF